MSDARVFRVRTRLIKGDMMTTRIRLLILCISLIVLGLIPASAQQQNNSVGVTSQRFEGGEMFYRYDTGEIIVLSNSTGRYWRIPSQEYGNLQYNPFSVSLPANRLHAINGFGRVWHNFQDIRNELGYGITNELGYTVRFTTIGNTTYMTRLNGVIVELNPTLSYYHIVDTIPQYSGATLDAEVSTRAIALGNNLTISWDAKGVDIVGISIVEDSEFSRGAIGEFFPLDASGQVDWQVPENLVNNFRVIVTGYQQSTKLFEQNAYDVVASSTFDVRTYEDTRLLVLTKIAFQQYQYGFMIWREDTGDVRVFYDGVRDGYQRWESYAVGTYSRFLPYGQPVQSGCIEAINGFGKVYSIEVVRNRLGCPISNEQSLNLEVTYSYSDGFIWDISNGTRLYLIDYTWESGY